LAFAKITLSTPNVSDVAVIGLNNVVPVTKSNVPPLTVPQNTASPPVAPVPRVAKLLTSVDMNVWKSAFNEEVPPLNSVY